jgi:serine/threonine protein kinase
VLRLSHANLVPTFDAGEVDGEFYIAMELVEGKDLREIWNRCVRRRTRIPLDVALHVAREMARALAYVHSLRRPASWSIATSRRPTSCSAISAR